MTTTEHSFVQSLQPILQEEILCARELLDVLNEERSALRERRAELLEHATSRKQEWVTRLEILARRQQQIFQRYAIQPEQLAGERNEPPLPEPLLESWQTLRGVLGRCRQQNRINGGMLEMSRRFSMQILDLMRGAGAGQRIYGKSGQTHSLGAKQPLGQA